MRKCCRCGDRVADDEGYESLGYVFCNNCFPKFSLTDKQRCCYCRKIMRKGDLVISLGDLGCGSDRDLACTKCADKHFSRANERFV